MESIAERPTPEDVAAAREFAALRNRCKQFLTGHGMGFDKFTIVGHDSYIGHVTEGAIRKYLRHEFPDCVHSIRTWEERFDVQRIGDIVEHARPSTEELRYVRDYFYDAWDLKITYNKGIIRADIKTALTRKEPADRWNFLYPVVQAKKPGKDLMILVYYVQNGPAITDLARLVLVGATTPGRVSRLRTIPAGEKTRFGTTSRIANYETELARDYRPVREFLC